MGRDDPSVYRLEAEGGVIDQYVFAGPAIADVLRRYTALTGRPPMPPRWALGYHQSRWGYSPDSKVLEVASELRSRGIGADGIWLDIQAMRGFRSFTFDDQTFADPGGMIASLEAQGFKVVSIVDPGIKVDPSWDIYQQGLDGGHYLPSGGAPYVGKVWPGDAVFPDFSSPAARTWFAGLVPRLTDHGVRGIWIDMNEPSDFIGPGGTVPADLAAEGDGAPSTMAELHNVYALNEARAVREGLRQAAPNRRPFVLTRAGYAGVQRLAAAWTGDAPSTFATLQTTVPMLLGLGLSGMPFVGSDVGGYSGGPSPELFARWMQLGALSPFFRGHVQEKAPAQEPWAFGIEVTDISRDVIALRYRLLPTLYSLFDEASRTGAPIVRPLVYEFQGDGAAAAVGDQLMLGPHLMAAPVLEEGASKRKVYLPEGRWYEQRSGAAHDGPALLEVDLRLAALPLFVREGGIVFFGPSMAYSDEAPLDPLTIELYPTDRPTTATLYEDEGDGPGFEQGDFSRVRYTLQRTAQGTLIEIGQREGAHQPKPRSVELRVRRVDHGVTAVHLGAEALLPMPSHEALVQAGQGYFVDEADRSVVVRFADRQGVVVQIDHDTTVDDLAPDVPMTFVVTVPEGTNPADTIHIATSSSGWSHTPMTWGPEPLTARAVVTVPRGSFVEYKYTRGGWETVEKWPGCVEATNRYAFGAAHPDKLDTVYGWADQCP